MAKRHEKASDVFAKASYAFSRKVGFQEAFPTVEEVKVEVEETEYGQSVLTHYHDSTIGTLGEYVNCTNPSCYNGGVRIGDILRQMVAKNLTEHESALIFCQGYEGSPKGRKRYRSCRHSFKVKARIKYKEAPLTPDRDQTSG